MYSIPSVGLTIRPWRVVYCIAVTTTAVYFLGVEVVIPITLIQLDWTGRRWWKSG